jgi:NADH-dependent peroxiredoxin subunit F
MVYDLIIIGGGPAGAAAAVYAARKQLNTLLILEDWGGQSAVSAEVQNWIGTPTISGADLADSLKKHVESYAGKFLTILKPARVMSLEPKNDTVVVHLSGKDAVHHEARAVLITTGARRRMLDVPGAKEFDQKGLTYCASCDGPLFADKDVVVIGGGNAGFETALQLLAYCKNVTLLHRGDKFKADEINVEVALKKPNMHTFTNAVPTAVEGNTFVSGLRWKDAKTGKESLLPVEGVFVEIGLLPNTEWLDGAVDMNEIKQVKVDPRTQRTSHPRVWAAGDCADGLYHQNNIAAGDAIKALEDIYMSLHRQ